MLAREDNTFIFIKAILCLKGYIVKNPVFRLT